MKRLFWVGMLVGVLHVACSSAAVFTVTNTGDSGSGTLRQAILNANTNAGADVIEFHLPASGVQTISPLTPLPDITNTVTINGYSQPGSQPNTAMLGGVNSVILVRLDGHLLTNGLPAALRINAASGSSVRGLVIVRFSFGIDVYDSSNVTIAGNWIGLDIDGIARGMTFEGVSVSCSVFSQAVDNRIGGTAPADRNVISGNGIGISFSTVSNNFVLGNLIGTDASGRLPRGNFNYGVECFVAINLVIGDGSLSGRNVISASSSGSGRGISILSGGGHLIQGNHIGTDISGLYDLGNGADGIFAQGTSRLRITGNQISGNRGNGIQFLGTSYCVIERNWIGTDAYSPSIFPLGNILAGVLINGNTNQIGSLNPWHGNVIQYNGGAGVAVTSGAQNEIMGNEIYGNGGLGIDLSPEGVTPNDEGEFDFGANRLQNFPLLAAATSVYGSLHVTGSLNSSPNAGFRLEFFASPAFDPDALAEGQLLLGAANLGTDFSGNASFDLMLSNAPPADYLITATATDTSGNTSEFSSGISIVAGPTNLSLSIERLPDNTLRVFWPTVAAFYQLETTDSLSPLPQWQTVTSGITTAGSWKQLLVTNSPAASNRFFRLHKP